MVFDRGVDYDFDGVPESWTEGDATVFTANGTDFVYRGGAFTRRPAVIRKRELGIDKDGTVWIDDGINYYSVNGTSAILRSRDQENPLTLGTTAPVAPYYNGYGQQGAEGQISGLSYVRKGKSLW